MAERNAKTPASGGLGLRGDRLIAFHEVALVQGQRRSGLRVPPLFAAKHQIVAMNHFGPPGKAEDQQNVRRGPALDLLGVIRVIGHQPAPDLVAIRTAHHDRIAPPEAALDLDDACR